MTTKPVASKKKSVVRKGEEALPRSSGGPFVKIEPNTRVDMIMLTSLSELTSIDQHTLWAKSGRSPSFPCIGEGCPGCELGNQSAYRAFLPVYVPEQTTSLVFSFGIRIAHQLRELEESLLEDGKTLKGRLIRVKRTGKGRDTTYSVVLTEKRYKVAEYEVPDVNEVIGPQSRVDIIRDIKASGFRKNSEDDEEEEEM